MHIVIEERTFPAYHQVKINDVWEPLHEHKWLLRIFIRAQELDEEGLVTDFLALQAIMDDLLQHYSGKNINKLPPFSEGLNPSTEYLAWLFYQKLAPKIDDDRVTLFKVELRESPTSWAVYTIDD